MFVRVVFVTWTAVGCRPAALSSPNLAFANQGHRLGAFVVEWNGRGWFDAALVVRHVGTGRVV